MPHMSRDVATVGVPAHATPCRSDWTVSHTTRKAQHTPERAVRARVDAAGYGLDHVRRRVAGGQAG
jgi:hypothetical protein